MRRYTLPQAMLFARAHIEQHDERMMDAALTTSVAWMDEQGRKDFVRTYGRG